MLRRQDVGHRVVVRRIVGIREDRPLFTDALGELVELTRDATHARDRQGHARRTRWTRSTGPSGCRRARRPTAADVIGAGTGRRRGLAGAGAAAGWATGCCARPRLDRPGQLGAAGRRPRPAAGGGGRRGRALVRRAGPAGAGQRAAAAGRAGRRRAGRARLDAPGRSTLVQTAPLRRACVADTGPSAELPDRSSWPTRRQRRVAGDRRRRARAACRTPRGTCSPPWTRSASPRCTTRRRRWSRSAGAR